MLQGPILWVCTVPSIEEFLADKIKGCMQQGRQVCMVGLFS